MAQSNDERLVTLHNLLARNSKAYAKEHPELFEPLPPYTDEEYADMLES